MPHLRNLPAAETASLKLLLDIALKAVEVDMQRRVRRVAQSLLRTAHENFRTANGIQGRVEQNSDAWRRMCDATAPEYDRLETAKRDVANAEKRLRTAIDSYTAALSNEAA